MTRRSSKPKEQEPEAPATNEPVLEKFKLYDETTRFIICEKDFHHDIVHELDPNDKQVKDALRKKLITRVV